MIDPDKLAQIEVLDPQGASVPLGSLWRDRSVVVALVRHFG